MNSPDIHKAIQIDRGFSGAICDEIADRLRNMLAREHDPLPQHLTNLVEQLARISRHSNQSD
jgi:hypothetical protein